MILFDEGDEDSCEEVQTNLNLGPNSEVYVNDKLCTFNAKSEKELKRYQAILEEAQHQEKITTKMVELKNKLLQSVSKIEHNRAELQKTPDLKDYKQETEKTAMKKAIEASLMCRQMKQAAFAHKVRIWWPRFRFWGSYIILQTICLIPWYLCCSNDILGGIILSTSLIPSISFWSAPLLKS